MIRSPISTIFAIVAALWLVPLVSAQDGATGNDSKLTISARFDPPKAKPGNEVDLVVEVEVADGWHVYGSEETMADPISLEVAETFGVETVGETRIPTGELHLTGTMESFWIEGKFEMRQRMRIDEDEGEGELSVEATIDYLVCDHAVCLPPASETVEATLEILDPEAEVEVAAPTPPADDVARADTGSKKPKGDAIGWGELLLLAIGAGLLALAMPCTYPMVPITFSFFTKQAEARGGNVLPLALTYGLGIVSIFVLIGVLAAPVIVPFATHWLTNAVIGIVFVIFAFALFGMITLEPPRFLQDFAGSASQKGGYVGVFLMGLCLVVSSFTCTVPFVGTMLSLSAQGGILKVVVGMAAFGLTMALPFVALALIPGKVSAMPRAGEWMNTLKVTLGFVELAAALKFFSNVDLVVNNGVADAWISRELFAAIWAVIFVITALYLIGIFSRGKKIGMKQRLAGLAFAAFAFFCGVGATGRPVGFVLTAIFPPSLHETRHELVLEDLEDAFSKAIAQDKLLLLNFTGLT